LRRRSVGYVNQFDVEDEVGEGRNPRVGCIGAGAALGAVSQLPGDEQAALSANLHAFKSLVEARKRPSSRRRSLSEWVGQRIAVLGFAVVAQNGFAILVFDCRPRMIVRGVELVSVIVPPVGAKPAGVVDLVNLVGLGIRAGAEHDVLVA
jgi:hypothetical protein